MARQALAVMTIRRFKSMESPCHKGAVSTGNRDVCAICLENFYPGQVGIILTYCSKTCLQGTPQYPRESVPA